MTKPVSSRTAFNYHGLLRTLFAWLVSEHVLTSSPMDRINPPIHRKDQVQPFTHKQVQAILDATRRSQHPRRDEAIVFFLLDTGVRASELCGLKMRDLDLGARSCRVVGKGDKERAVCFGRSTAQALWRYLREQEREPDEPVFLSDRGRRAGEPLTRSGLLQLIHRLGESAGVQVTRCSPHTFRHTFAIEFLRAGGNVFSLQQMLGHTALHMTNKYVAYAQADIENQHRQFSPVERLKRQRTDVRK
jgi:site-specific recombinase XerD